MDMVLAKTFGKELPASYREMARNIPCHRTEQSATNKKEKNNLGSKFGVLVD